jgi:hypothetical protein
VGLSLPRMNSKGAVNPSSEQRLTAWTLIQPAKGRQLCIWDSSHRPALHLCNLYHQQSCGTRASHDMEGSLNEAVVTSSYLRIMEYCPQVHVPTSPPVRLLLACALNCVAPRRQIWRGVRGHSDIAYWWIRRVEILQEQVSLTLQ